MIDLLKIPGFAEAVMQERVNRDAAFLDVTEDIAGFPASPMNLRHYLILTIAKNSLMFKAMPSHEQLAQFLWVLNPGHNAEGIGRDRFFKSCQCFLPTSKPRIHLRYAMRIWEETQTRHSLKFFETVSASLSFVDEALSDKPPQRSRGGFWKQYYSDACFWCASMAREYHYSRQEVMTMPIKCLFQFLNESKEHGGSKVPLCNPSDSVLADWQRAQRRN